MNCYDVKQKVGNYLDTALTENEMHGIAQHLKKCTDCTSILESLKQIESLMKVDVYEEPPEEYWATLPNKITNRIGLHSPATKTKKISDLLNEWLPKNSLVWGFTGVVAILTLILGIKQVYKVKSVNPPVIVQQTEDVQLNSEEVQIKPEETEQNLVSTSIEENAKQTTPVESFEQTNDSNPIVEQQPRITAVNNKQTTELLILSDFYIEKYHISKFDNIAIRKQKFDLPDYNQHIYPIPNSVLIYLDYQSDSEDETESSVTAWRTYSLTNNVSSSQKAKRLNISENSSEPKSSYSEILTITKKSKALSEKRNIWMSYISWETAITYRLLGIYNLALVLSDIAEKTQDLEKAKEALKFYHENEESLRFQMGNALFQSKIELFKQLLVNKSLPEN